MSVIPDPVWPVLALAAIQLGDGIMCIKPVAFVAQCLEDVHFPHRWWPVMPVIKLAAAAGLIAGIWVPGLGVVTGSALILYFLFAVGAHIRARDLSRNLFVNATGMLVLSIAVTLYSFVL